MAPRGPCGRQSLSDGRGTPPCHPPLTTAVERNKQRTYFQWWLHTPTAALILLINSCGSLSFTYRFLVGVLRSAARPASRSIFLSLVQCSRLLYSNRAQQKLLCSLLFPHTGSLKSLLSVSCHDCFCLLSPVFGLPLTAAGGLIHHS